MYGNELASGPAVSRWLARTSTPRSELWITQKVISVDRGVEATCRASLKKMGVGYFDLYLVHAPFWKDGSAFEKSLPAVWREMEGLVEQGLVKNIGVSNWRVSDLAQIYDGATIKPAVNQIEAHPYLQQPKLLDYCKRRNIRVVAYAPLSPITKRRGGPVDAAVNAAAKAHGKTTGQVLLRWSAHMGMLAVTTTSKPARLRESLDVFSFELTPAEVDAISEAGKTAQHRAFFPFVGFPDS